MLLTLETPCQDRISSYRSLVREFVERGEKLVPFVLEFPSDPADEFLQHLEACSRGEGLPVGFVAHSTFWLTLDNSEVVGVSNLRHRLTDKLRNEGGNIGYGIRPSARRRGFAKILLRETLHRARDVGLEEAWLTCAKGNTASVNTILGNGGTLMSEAFIEARGEVVQRYRIDLAPIGNLI